jgi:hypothetical protein
MALSLNDHSDTWVNATTFIHTSNVCLQDTRGCHSTQVVTSQGTVAGKACAPQESSTKQFIQAEIARSSIHSRERATRQQDLSYSGERDLLARKGSYKRESLDDCICILLMSNRGHWRAHSAGSSAGAFLYVFFLQGVPLLCHLVLC